jgi:hypothetical protein
MGLSFVDVLGHNLNFMKMEEIVLMLMSVELEMVAVTTAV